MPAFGIGPVILSESRLSGNGEETRSRLNGLSRFSGSTQGPVTSLHSALPRSARQLSEASWGDFFPVIVSVRFAVGRHFTGLRVVCQSLFSIFDVFNIFISFRAFNSVIVDQGTHVKISDSMIRYNESFLRPEMQQAFLHYDSANQHP